MDESHESFHHWLTGSLREMLRFDNYLCFLYLLREVCGGDSLVVEVRSTNENTGKLLK